MFLLDSWINRSNSIRNRYKRKTALQAFGKENALRAVFYDAKACMIVN